ncbi:MAG: Rab family GTPase [Promethearchaeota archaeon]
MYKFKITLLGEGGVGKTSLILRYVKNYFMEDLKKTIGTNFMIKRIDFDNESVQLIIYDIGAQQRFKSMRARYFQGSSASIAVFDLTNNQSLYALPNWITSVREICGSIPIIVVGNKLDLKEKRIVPESDGRNFASRFTCMYREVSAKLGDGVKDLFEGVAAVCLKNFKECY